VAMTYTTTPFNVILFPIDENAFSPINGNVKILNKKMKKVNIFLASLKARGQ
jgi:hypothetical protein